MNDTKRERLLRRLQNGWASVPDLTSELGWLPHTLRAVLSSIAKTFPIERQRVDGVTSYRIAPVSRAEQRNAAE